MKKLMTLMLGLGLLLPTAAIFAQDQPAAPEKKTEKKKKSSKKKKGEKKDEAKPTA